MWSHYEENSSSSCSLHWDVLLNSGWFCWFFGFFFFLKGADESQFPKDSVIIFLKSKEYNFLSRTEHLSRGIKRGTDEKHSRLARSFLLLLLLQVLLHIKVSCKYFQAQLDYASALCFKMVPCSGEQLLPVLSHPGQQLSLQHVCPAACRGISCLSTLLTQFIHSVTLFHWERFPL